MKIIVQRSAAIASFFGLLGLSLSAPQQQHVQRVADLLVVAPRRKTLAELAAQEFDGVDPSNLADFFRISPWDADDVRLPLIAFILQYLKARMAGSRQPIYLIADDSLAIKDKGTRHIEAVDWFFDHKSKRPVRASNHVSLGIMWGDYYFPLGEQLYLRRSTVRKHNRKRRGCKLVYRSKLELLWQLIRAVTPCLPDGVPVYVLFDSWYASAQLIRWIRLRGWHVIAGVKSNRKVAGLTASAWHRALKGRRYDRVRLRLANGNRRTYRVRSQTGRLRGVPGEVRLLISHKDRGGHAPRYFLCTDTSLSCQEVLQRYQKRWAIETDYWWAKLDLGLGDYRLRSYEAVDRWYTVVYAVLAYLYWHKYEHAAAGGGTIRLSEVLQGLRQAHQREWLRRACAEAAAGVPLEQVLERYVGPAPAA
jgi:DDE superfamily endonuclease